MHYVKKNRNITPEIILVETAAINQQIQVVDFHRPAYTATWAPNNLTIISQNHHQHDHLNDTNAEAHFNNNNYHSWAHIPHNYINRNIINLNDVVAGSF